MLNEKINTIKAELAQYATLVEKMLNTCMQGLLKKDKTLLDEVIKNFEPKVNAIEIDIDQICISMIAQFEPRAKDLRTILMILKMNNDLERMGDHVVNIAESAIYLIEKPSLKPLMDITLIAENVAKMLHDSINAFINEDPVLAKAVCERDDIIDNAHEQVLRVLITYMSADPTTIERSLHILRISSNLERIADLSTNIGEDVLFIVQGRVIKHHFGDKGDNNETK